MYFCNDADLLTWEPGLFLEAAFIHQALFKNAAATISETNLTMNNPQLGDVQPGMVIAVTQGELTQLLEIVEVADDRHATVSALRGRSNEPAIASLVNGSVQATLITFRPQIAAVGDALMALLGVSGDRSAALPAISDVGGFRTATIFETLAALYRVLVDQKTTANVIFPKLKFYETLAAGARRAISATIDTDADGTPDRSARADIVELHRA
jgi:hypothetical protein